MTYSKHACKIYMLYLLLLVNKEELKSAERPLLKSIFTFMSDQITA